ncbi:MAG: AEC family transporter [Dehalobacterium sp.]
MILLNAVQGVLSIIILLAVGYYLSHKGWFDDNTGRLFSRMVTNLSLPAYMVSNMLSTYDKEALVHLANGLAAPYISMMICYATGMLVAKLIKVGPNRFGTFSSMFGLSNTIFVGLPINLALFGDQSIPYVMLYYIANTILFWTIGTYGVRRDGEKGKLKILTFENMKKIFSPPLTAILFAIVLILLGIKLPKSIMESCKYLGNMTTPLAVIFIGIVIYSVKLKSIKLTKDMTALLLGRFILAPAIIMGICYKLPLPVLMKQVFVIQAAMPVMTQTPIIARMYGADYEYAAVMTTVTTIVSLFMIPIYMILISSGIF